MQLLKRLIFFILISILPGKTIAQISESLSYKTLDSLIKIPLGKGDMKETRKYLEIALEKARKEFGENDSTFAQYTNNIGFTYAESGDYKMAESLYLKALKIRKNVLGNLHKDYASSLNNLASLYFEIGEYEKAEKMFLEAKELQSKTPGESDLANARVLNNLAILYKTQGKFENAEQMLIAANEIFKKGGSNTQREYISSLNNLGLFYKSVSDFQKAEKYYLEANAILKKASMTESPAFALNLHNLGSLYLNSGNHEKAELYILKGLNLREKLKGKEDPEYSESLNLLAGFYNNTGKPEKALQYFLEADKIRHKIFGNKHPKTALTQLNLASVYLEMEKPDSALFYIKAGILANCPNLHALDPYNIEVLIGTELISDDILSKGLKELLQYLDYEYKKTKSPALLKSKLTVSETALRISGKTKNSMSDDADKLRSLKSNAQFIENGIASLVELGNEVNLKRAFLYAEKNKSIILADAIKGNKAQNLGYLPDSLAAAERSFHKKISELKKKQLQSTNPDERAEIAAELTKIQIESNEFLKFIHKNYPKYHSLKYEDITADAAEIQKMLDKNSLFLEYFQADSLLYLFVLERNDFRLISIPLSRKLMKEKVADLMKSLSNYTFIKENREEAFSLYCSQASEMYDLLLKAALKGTKKKNLIIVPDGELAYLPFESFLSKPCEKGSAYLKLSYLLNDYSISYNYSATLWKENKSAAKQQKDLKILAMAADYGKQQQNSSTDAENEIRKGLSPLPAAKKEVQNLQLEQYFKGNFLFDELATEAEFKKQAPEYAIIHLAMHGILDKKNPLLSALAFTAIADSNENNLLQAYEISKMQLQAELVVLSACETGYGKFQQGEGVMSLARAFMYAGVPSLVVSLWQVNDASTAEIMKLFYANLAKGMDKAEALRQAKLKYIAECKNPLMAHPAFWAAFVQIGDSRPVKIAMKTVYWPWILGLALLLGTAFILIKRSPKSIN